MEARNKMKLEGGYTEIYMRKELCLKRSHNIGNSNSLPQWGWDILEKKS